MFFIYSIAVLFDNRYQQQQAPAMTISIDLNVIDSFESLKPSVIRPIVEKKKTFHFFFLANRNRKKRNGFTKTTTNKNINNK